MNQMKAVIYDYKDRRDELHNALTLAGWECDVHENVYEIKDRRPTLRELGDQQLVLLHLGGEKTQGIQCGNEKSWGFFQEKLVKLDDERKRNTCLIAYSGGGAECSEPIGLVEYRNKGCPWVYFNGVNGPQDINLQEFAEAWKAAPDAGPPLHILYPPLPQIGALKLLILGYQEAHGCCKAKAKSCLGKENSTKVQHSWTQNLDWWLPVLGKDMSRADAMIELLDKQELKDLVGKLVGFYSSVKTNEFPHSELCNFSLLNKSAA